MPALKPMEFINFLTRECQDRIVPNSEIPAGEMWGFERGENNAFHDIIQYITVWKQDWEAEQALTRGTWDSAISAIEIDIRREFDNPELLIDHIHKIATKEPFLGNAKVSLKAIAGFTGDFLRNHRIATKQEQLKHAPF